MVQKANVCLVWEGVDKGRSGIFPGNGDDYKVHYAISTTHSFRTDIDLDSFNQIVFSYY